MLYALIGKSGAGKDVLKNALVERDNFIHITTTTSRPVREGEVEGREYHFISEEEFLKKIENNEFAEYRTYNTVFGTWYYGSPMCEIDKDKDYVIILDIGGAKKFLESYKETPTKVIYIEAPDSIREERAKLRDKNFNKAEWDRRLIDDEKVFAPEIINDFANIKLLNNGDINDLYNAFHESIKEYDTSWVNEVDSDFGL